MGNIGGGVDAAVGRGSLQVSASTQTVGFRGGDFSRTAASQIVPLIIAVTSAGGCAGECVTARVGVRAFRLNEDEIKGVKLKIL